MAERLQKYLARAGVASRRDAELLIEQGHVKVNNKVVTTLGTQIEPGVDIIEFRGRRIELDPRRVYLLVYKPEHVITSLEDPEGRECITKFVPPDFGRLYPVGRLDYDSEGAVLMTNDGDLTQLLTHPRHEFPKTYVVKVSSLVADIDPRIERLRDGVVLEDGYRTRPAEIYRDSDTGRHTWFVVTIREGHNRQIRRMFEAISLDVRKLRRIAYGPVLLGDLAPGDFRRLSEDEIDELYLAAGKTRPRMLAARGRVPVGQRDGKVLAAREARRVISEAAGEPNYVPRPAPAPVAPAPPPEPTRNAAGRRGAAREETNRAAGREVAAQRKDRKAAAAEQAAPTRDARPPRADGPARDGRPPARDGRPPARDTRPPRADGPQRDSRPPRGDGPARDSRPPRRDDQAPRRDGPPPRDSRPPRADGPARDSRPPRRDDQAPRRDGPPPRDSRPPRADGPARDSRPPRRDDQAPRRDGPPARDSRPPRADGPARDSRPPRRDDQAPRRDGPPPRDSRPPRADGPARDSRPPRRDGPPARDSRPARDENARPQRADERRKKRTTDG